MDDDSLLDEYLDERLPGRCCPVAVMAGALDEMLEIGEIEARIDPDRSGNALSRARNRILPGNPRQLRHRAPAMRPRAVVRRSGAAACGSIHGNQKRRRRGGDFRRD
ncbi:MAG: hypothetical protein OXQ89_05665 [Rhodospirillaceae bacterium]|nr:hypothetical protein [Rhodospirillaceae bacterium]